MSQAPRDDELIVVEQLAADWMVRRDHGLSRAEKAGFARWLAADERHRAAFKALDATWQLMGDVRGGASFEDGDASHRRGSLRWVPVMSCGRRDITRGTRGSG